MKTKSKYSKIERNIIRDFLGLKKLWPYLKSEKKLIIFAICLIPVISLIQLLGPQVLSRAIDSGIEQKNFNNLLGFSLFYAGIVLLEYLSRASQRISTSIAVHRMVRSLRKILVTHILRLSPRFHDKSLSGALTTRATSDFDNLSESLNQGVLGAIVDVSSLLFSIIGLFILNPYLAAVLIITLPLVAGSVTWLSWLLKKFMLVAREKLATQNAFLQEGISGSRTLKLLGASKYASEKFNTLSIKYRDAQIKTVLIDALLFSIIDGMSSISIGLVLWMSVSKLNIDHSLSAGILVAAVQYVHQIFEPLKQLGSKMAMLQGAFTAMERIFDILTNKDFIPGDKSIRSITGRISFKDTSFSYQAEKTESKIINSLSFDVIPGQKVAIVGSTGSGKSTVLKLLMKMYSGYTGSIKIDGIEISQIEAQSLREKISYVPQDIAIFNASVLFNITMGNKNISSEAAKKAAITVGADKFINQLNSSYEFIVSENGGNLSQGEKQLLIFARALAGHPSLILLDEATSSIDQVSEKQIQKAINKILKEKTVIVVAHRLTTIKNCDLIVLMKDGSIVEKGTHEELLKNSNEYHRLYNSILQSEQSKTTQPAL